MAAHKSIHRQELAFAAETTACVAPADDTAWASDGTSVEFIAVDANPKEALVVDPTAEKRWQSVGKRRRIRGIRNTDWSATLKWHGLGAATSEDSQASHNYLTTIMSWVCGGSHRSYTREVASSANAYTLTVGNGLTTGFIPGCLVAVEDTTSPTDQNEGALHFARVASVDGATHTITLTEALPFTPAAGDVIHGVVTIYVDEDYLEDAIRAGAVRTYSWLLKRAMTGTDELWQFEGTVAGFALQNLSRGQLPQVVLNMMSANFKHSGEDGLASPTFSSVSGKPQLSMGIGVRASIASTAATTRGAVDVNTAAFEPGFTRTRVETGTEEVNRFHGMSTYSVAPGDVKFTATIVPNSPAWYASIADAIDYRIMYYQAGPGGSAAAGAGKAWALCIPRAQVAVTPDRVDVNEVHGVSVEFAAMEPNDTSGGSNEDLEKSLFLLGFA